MNSQEFDRALETISDPLIDSAARAYDRGKRRPGYKKYLRIAAAAAAVVILLTALSFWHSEREIITGPSLLTVKVYGVNNDDTIPVEGVVLEEGIQLITEKWNRLSNRPGLTILFSVPEDAYDDKDISYEIQMSGGSFSYQGNPRDENGDRLSPYEYRKLCYLGNQFTIDKNGFVLYFRPYIKIFNDEIQNDKSIYVDDQQVFANVIIYCGRHIVGYAVIEFFACVDSEEAEAFLEQHPELEGVSSGEIQWNAHGAELLEAKSFPMVNGRFQRVDREYVEEQFQRIRSENIKE